MKTRFGKIALLNLHFNLKYKIINAEYAVFQFGDYDSKVHLKNHIKNMTDDSSQHFDINSVSFCHKWYLMYIRNIFFMPSAALYSKDKICHLVRICGWVIGTDFSIVKY